MPQVESRSKSGLGPCGGPPGRVTRFFIHWSRGAFPRGEAVALSKLAPCRMAIFDKLDRRCFDRAPLSRLKGAETDRPDGMADQPQGRESDRRSQASHLAILSLDDDDFQPTRRNCPAKADWRIARPDRTWFLDVLDLAGTGQEVPEVDAATQARQIFRSWRALDLRSIALFKFACRMGDRMSQGVLRGEKERALAVGIEPPRRIYAG